MFKFIIIFLILFLGSLNCLAKDQCSINMTDAVALKSKSEYQIVNAFFSSQNIKRGAKASVVFYPHLFQTNLPIVQLAKNDFSEGNKENMFYTLELPKGNLSDLPTTLQKSDAKDLSIISEVIVIYPEIKHPVSILSIKNELINTIAHKYVKLALDTNADSKPDILFLDFDCNQVQKSGDSADLSCKEFWQSIDNKWIKCSSETPL